MAQPKHGIPALLSFFIPGLGQIVKGQIARALCVWFWLLLAWVFAIKNLLLFSPVGILALIGLAIVWFWQIYDAYNYNPDKEGKTVKMAPTVAGSISKDRDELVPTSSMSKTYVPELERQSKKAVSKLPLGFVLGFGCVLVLIVLFSYYKKGDPTDSKSPVNTQSAAKEITPQSRSTTTSRIDLKPAKEPGLHKSSAKVGVSTPRQEATPAVDSRARRSKLETERVPVGPYKIMYSTPVFSEPREDSDQVAVIDPGTKVNVVAIKGEWLEVRSKHGRPPGFIKRESALPWGD